MKKYYLIDYPFDHFGFFAYFCFFVGQLDYAFENELTPVVDWSKSKFLEDNMGINPFDYFFDGNIELLNVNEFNTVICPRVFEFIVKGQRYVWPVGYPPRSSKLFHFKDVVTNLNFLFNNYFKVKSNIMNEVNSEILKYKTLGVHCRRSDMALYHPENTSCVETEDFFNKTMKVFRDYNFEKIYLATEEEEILNFFLKEIPDKILYQDCHRLKKGEKDFWHHPDVSLRDNHKYLIGKEVLLDALSLSYCNSLLTGISGVTYGSIIFNGLKYENVFYFDEIKNNL